MNLSKMAIIKNPETINAGEDVEKREHSCIVGRNVTNTTSMEDRMEIPLKTRNNTAL